MEKGRELNILCVFSQKLIGKAFVELIRKSAPSCNVELHTCLSESRELQLINGFQLAFVDEALKSIDISECIQSLKKRKEDLKIIVLGDNSKLAAFPLVMSGANGYLEKSSEEFELSRAIEVAMNGGTYLPQRLVLQLMEAEKNSKGFQRRLELLTPNEKLLLYELSKGGTLSQIGSRTNKAITTLSTQKRRVMQKLRVTSNHELLTLIKEMGAQDFS
jgi:two-component system, NarL family, response regulator, fimbrial Z protein, FimZ